ncbi:hypothetical protein B0T10DRAFT_473346 [Thelonectria olida]|uniref:Uncharacterized protein n=1 Tax=Thelonectria olida TaxID=1576542 RepID=A0A9P9AVW6_9HYPO|nr:hypothetical protein B0T10DRAFT_473346 [Thelonectria olida]
MGTLASFWGSIMDVLASWSQAMVPNLEEEGPCKLVFAFCSAVGHHLSRIFCSILSPKKAKTTRSCPGLSTGVSGKTGRRAEEREREEGAGETGETQKAQGETRVKSAIDELLKASSLRPKAYMGLSLCHC